MAWLNDGDGVLPGVIAALNKISFARCRAAANVTTGYRPMLTRLRVFRKALFETVGQLQQKLDIWIEFYNTERTHQGKLCWGRTALKTLIDCKAAWLEKRLDYS
ncbi:MAG TPA: hypothetical protein VMX97_02520 [Hyphomicrobiaceae bacterium]|nr:hypothetical protein [Hyphomicrobiaceae bacterium]